MRVENSPISRERGAKGFSKQVTSASMAPKVSEDRVDLAAKVKDVFLHVGVLRAGGGVHCRSHRRLGPENRGKGGKKG